MMDMERGDRPGGEIGTPINITKERYQLTPMGMIQKWRISGKPKEKPSRRYIRIQGKMLISVYLG